MYSDPNLDAPPPRSQFRRPWSPEAFDPYPSGRDGYSTAQHGLYSMLEHHHDEEPRSHGTSPHRQQQQRRQASDVSVEALDLADYARTLRTRQAEDPYPPFPSQIRQGQGQGQENRPLSSFPAFPQPSTNSRDTLRTNAPSPVSRGPTLSSLTTHHTSLSSVPSRGRHSSRRPFSLPVTPTPFPPSSHPSSSRGHIANSYAPHSSPYIADPDNRAASSQEIDISNFPKWSRNWYNSNNPSARYNHRHSDAAGDPVSDADIDIYAPIPGSQLPGTRGNNKKSHFDPGYVHDPYTTDPYSPYDLPPPLSSTGHGSRDVLPWSKDPPEYGPALDPLQKEERMRMLEREFGANAKGKDKARDDGRLLVDDMGNPLVGTIDERGRLVTVGPKRRVALRTLQVLLAVGACVPALYAAVAIKQQPQDPQTTLPSVPPPPAGKPPVIVLYVLSVITLLLLLYMFVVRPCCCVRAKARSSSASSKNPLGAAANMGMMVLPVGGDGGGKKKNKKNKKGGKKGVDKGDVQVNLIVDPTMFQPPGGDSSTSESESDDDDGMPGGYDQQAKRKTKEKHRRRRRRRRGLLEGLAMEAEWKVARAWAKKLAVLDVAGVVLWGAAFVFIMTGKRCPSGGFNGWCNAYNVSSASACLLCVAFGVSLFFDVQDLHASKQSPRTRTS
ncbi:hypothetical protein CVT25_014322 [Psilocybe cyanescens]|uniref:Uncharacterized protein n=1 Tax=Psilocybe cyanescens TaxID=93625 RepID=A0A409XL16_PSICY|nr:hypothetical protein CVT25_014322 [Psilocybe cyanescens]